MASPTLPTIPSQVVDHDKKEMAESLRARALSPNPALGHRASHRAGLSATGHLDVRWSDNWHSRPSLGRLGRVARLTMLIESLRRQESERHQRLVRTLDPPR